MPNVSIEMTADQINQVSTGKMEANLQVKHKQNLSKADKAKLVVENGEYIDPKDSVFTLARPDIGEYQLAKYDKINIQILGYSRGDLGFSSNSGDATM